MQEKQIDTNPFGPLAPGRIMYRLAFIMLLVFFPLVCRAGGTLGFAEIDPLLKQKPYLSSFLDQSFELPDSAFAEVRLGPQFKYLSAHHFGPYTFRAKPKSGENATVLITLCTRYEFLDAKGKKLSKDADDMYLAHRFREELIAVLIQEISAENRRPECPEQGSA